jgi:hypothetical protein
VTNLSELIERIEAATGPDRSIDEAIYHDLLGFCRHANKERTGAQSDTGFDCLDCGADSWGNKSRKGGYPAGQGLHDSAPRYTTSLDAARTLVPDNCLYTVRTIWDGDKQAGLASVSIYERAPGLGQPRLFWMGEHQIDAATPALALCAAALKAREAM